MIYNPRQVHIICISIKSCSCVRKKIIEALLGMDQQSVSFVALEVAREFSEFQDRKELH